MNQPHKPNCPDWVKLAVTRVQNRKHFGFAGNRPKPRYKTSESRLIVTVATGDDFQKIFSITRPLMEAYADNCGADFMALTRTTQDFPLFEKFRIKPLVEAFDRTIFIDADCIVRPGASNLFDIVPEDMVGMHDDLGDKDHRWWALTEWKKLEESQKEDIPFLERVLNTGVIVVSRKHANIFTPPELPIPGNHCDEQFWIDRNVDFYGHQWFNVPLSHNCQWWIDDFDELAKDAEIVHLSAAPDRVNLARQFVEEINNEKSKPANYAKAFATIFGA